MATLKTDQLETESKLNGFEPLSIPLFRDLWLASIVSNLGGWMQDTAGTWLMTVLTPSPLLIALMQTAASLPALFLAFPAGGAADIFARRRLLLFWQSWMLASVAMAPTLWVLAGSAAGMYGVASALLIVFMHRANIARLRAGSESVLPLFRR